MAVAQMQRKKKQRTDAVRPAGIVEFGAAAHEHVEGAFFDVTQLTGTSAVQLGPYEVPAYGYMRNIDILVTVSAAGALGTGVLGEDFPFNIIDSVALLDVNGAPIVGPITGYDLYVANLYGGYAFRQDPTLQPDFSATYTTASFILRVPIEIHSSTGLGSLPNQNAAASYKVQFTVAALATQLSSVGTATANTYRFRGYLEAWTQPNDTDMAGRPQAIVPPRVGTTQYWSLFIKSVSTGQQTVVLPRVGNLIRALIFILRTAAAPAGTRSNTNFPDPIQINWDARAIILEARQLRRTYQTERYIFGSGGVPAGVFVYDFDHDILGHGGNGTPELWWPTLQSTRLELFGTFGASGELRVLTNDVAPVEINPAERYVETSETGFQPMPVGAPRGQFG
jgi:hypothetical protein